MIGSTSYLSVPLQQIIPKGTRVEVFNTIYWVFLGLGTVVGVVVIGYMLYNAYKYRDGATEEDDVEDRPELGELPTGGGKGRKLFLSFALSAIIVVSLVVWTYGTLLYVENAAADQAAGPGEDPLVVEVEGFQFAWEFHYPNGNTTLNKLRVPEDRMIKLKVTSRDVWHNFGIPDWRVKSDAIPGQVTTTWFVASETGTFTAKCYELCGTGHSGMNAQVVVMEPEAYKAWYQNTTNDSNGWVGDTFGKTSGGEKHSGSGSEGGESGESGGSGHRVVPTDPITSAEGMTP